MEELKYPIGHYKFNQEEGKKVLEENIRQLAEFPIKLTDLVSSINENDYAKTYRPDGWNIRQLVHNLADSHANMYIRVKSAVANDEANIMGYDEAKWANFPDNELPLTYSLMMIEGMHARITALLTSYPEEDFKRSYYHNGDKRTYSLLEVVGLYVWHGNHHLAHIKLALAS